MTSGSRSLCAFSRAATTSRLADIRAARETGAVTALRTVLGGTVLGAPEQVAEVTGALRRGAEAADTAGRPLFAGLAGLPWPADELGQLWHACSMLRELRGDSHLAACVAAGLTGLEANIITELQVGWPLHSYTATRGWPPEAMNVATLSLRERGLIGDDALTGAGASLRADIEEATDRQLAPARDAIGPDLAGILPLLQEWSQQIIEHGWFPPDPYKRASG